MSPGMYRQICITSPWRQSQKGILTSEEWLELIFLASSFFTEQALERRQPRLPSLRFSDLGIVTRGPVSLQVPCCLTPAPELPSWVQPQASAPPALPPAQLAGLASLSTGTGDSSSSAASCDVSPTPSAWLPNNPLPCPIPRPSPPGGRSRSRRNTFQGSSSSPVLYCLSL